MSDDTDSLMAHNGPRVFTITSSDIARCPKQSLAPSHYHNDGTCRCDEESDA